MAGGASSARSGNLMRIKQGAISGLVILSMYVAGLRARLGVDDLVPPAPENLDIPPEETIDAEKLQELGLARHAAQFPKEFHDLVLQLRPEWAGLEAAAVPAIADPVQFLKNHPKDPEEVDAEEKAKDAILHPTRIGQGIDNQT